MGRSSRDRAGDVEAVVAAGLPGYRVASVALLGEGQDNVAYEVNGELIVRFGKEPDPGERAARADRDARLLSAVAGVSPLPVPEPVFTAAGQGCLGYFKLPGVPLIGLPEPWRSAHGRSVALALGAFLGALHRMPSDLVAGLVEVDDEPKEVWLREAAENYAAVTDRVPEAHRPAVEAFLAAAPPPDGPALVFSHNDLGIEHVLVDAATGAVTGIIDWSDAAITDPAQDFGLLYRDLGPGALDAALRRHRSGVQDLGAMRTRAVFYARCSVLEDLAYGLEPGHGSYLGKSLAALRWLYPAASDPLAR